MIITVGIVFVILAAVVLVQYNTYKSKLDCNKKYCQQILTQAAAAFTANDVTEQRKIVNRVTHIFRYDTQPNYMYVVTQYYINLSDSVNARKSYNKLMVVYNSNKGFSKNFGSYVLTTDQLKQSVEFLEKKESTDKANFGGVKQ